MGPLGTKTVVGLHPISFQARSDSYQSGAKTKTGTSAVCSPSAPRRLPYSRSDGSHRRRSLAPCRDPRATPRRARLRAPRPSGPSSRSWISSCTMIWPPRSAPASHARGRSLRREWLTRTLPDSILRRSPRVSHRAGGHPRTGAQVQPYQRVRARDARPRRTRTSCVSEAPSHAPARATLSSARAARSSSFAMT